MGRYFDTGRPIALRMGRFALILAFLSCVRASAQPLVPRGSSWRFLPGEREASSPLSAWRQPGFDDSSWEAGAAPIRYGDGTGGTELADMRGRYSTVFLRRSFEIDRDSLPDSLRLTIDFDDGFALWINGKMLHAVNAPSPPLHDALATGSHESGAFESWTLDVPEGLLFEGENVVAVQGFNTSLNSSDFMLNVEIEGVLRVADTKFSHDRGFYDAPFDVEITTETPDATIRFTTDGSAPSETRGEIHAGPIAISGTTVLRAIAYREGHAPTNVDTQSYIFLEQVLRQPRAIPGWQLYDYTSGTGSPSTHDYEMDSEVVDAPAYRDEILDGLLSIPTMCLSMDAGEFWDVYRGSAEGAVSVEVIDPAEPDASEQVDCAMVRHSHNRVKNSFRLRFKREFGATKFRSGIFRKGIVNGDSATDEFDRMVLRAGNNRSWARNFNDGRCAYTRDQWYRDTEIEMTGYGAHGAFVHLYVNGIYWGLYNPCEKPDAWFASAYFGGEREDWWDSAGHGSTSRWNHLRNDLTGRDMRVDANYDELREYLDVRRICDYLMLTWMTGMTDWPGNNWQAVNRNLPGEPTLYFGWDCEWSWDTTQGSNLGAWVHRDFRRNDSGGPTIAALWNAAKHNDDFMMLFADRVARHCTGDGALTDERSRARWATLNEAIAGAMIAESARWGDATRSRPYTRDIEWRNEVERLDRLMDGNVARFLAALRNEGYYPKLDAPRLLVDGVEIEGDTAFVPSGFDVGIRSEGGGGIYYTIDGADPRLRGGAISGTAIAGGTSADVRIDGATILKTRARRDGEWSALRELVCHTPQNFGRLRITEIMYHPPGADDIDGDEFEFVELKNTGRETLNLSGVRFTDGIEYVFPFGSRLAPGEFVVLASNGEAFEIAHPGVNVFDVYRKRLSNAGETLALADALGETIASIPFDDRAPWPETPDGGGVSLVPSSACASGDPGEPESWTTSHELGGSPGRDDAPIEPIAPSVERSPRNVTAESGATVAFTVAATGCPEPIYQWQRNGIDIPGATEWILVLSPLPSTFHASRFRCVVMNELGSAMSETALLTIPDGVTGPSFIRGDCNDDGVVNLSDSLCILDWLFRGAEAPGCVAAVNANGDLRADLSDAVSILTHLFLGAESPAPPFPDCGPGELPGDESLGCEREPTSCARG